MIWQNFREGDPIREMCHRHPISDVYLIQERGIPIRFIAICGAVEDWVGWAWRMRGDAARVNDSSVRCYCECGSGLGHDHSLVVADVD